MSAPALANRNADQITPTSARLNGQVALGSGTTVYIKHGLSDGGNTGGSSLGAWDKISPPISATVGVDYHFTATDLIPGRVYYFTAYGTNADGDGYAFEGGADPQTFYFSTPYAPFPDSGARTGTHMEAGYRAPQKEACWSDCMCPLNYVASFRTSVVGQVQSGNILNHYACKQASVVFDYRKTDAAHHFFNYSLSFTSPGRITFTPTDQTTRPMSVPFLSATQIKMSFTPQYCGEPSAAESWKHLRGTWRIVADVFINPIVPPSDGSTYRIRAKAVPLIANGDPEQEFFSTACGTGWSHIDINVFLRSVCFWTIYLYVECDVGNSSIPDNTAHLCQINGSAQRLSPYLITEAGSAITTESGDVLTIET